MAVLRAEAAFSIRLLPVHLLDGPTADLQDRGFKFVGSTICYALMQATGLVNDHTTNCFPYDQVG